MAPATILCLVLLFILLRTPAFHRFVYRGMQRSHRNRMKRYTKARKQRVR